MFYPKQILNRLIGHGPWKAAPFSDILRLREAPEKGVHRPEEFDGLVGSAGSESPCYSEGFPLLGQPPTCEQIQSRPRYLGSGIAPSITKNLFSLSQAGIMGVEGLVYCARSRRAVEESMRCWIAPVSKHPSFAAPGFPQPLPLDGCTLNLATLSGEGFYHFLLESLPRLYLARNYLTQIKTILVNGSAGSFQEKWLARAGVDSNRIIWMDGLSHYHCEQLLFTNHLIADYRPDTWTIHALRELLGGHPGKAGVRKIWISRSDAKSRQPKWESDVLAELKDFESVNLAGMEPGAQIDLMKSAAVVAAPHGAGLSNVIFCAPGTKVIEIFPDSHRQPIYGRLANVCGLPHAWAVINFNETPGSLGKSILRFINTNVP